jgi:hypothetical protein
VFLLSMQPENEHYGDADSLACRLNYNVCTINQCLNSKRTEIVVKQIKKNKFGKTKQIENRFGNGK